MATSTLLSVAFLLIFAIPASISSSSRCHPADETALLAIKASLKVKDTNNNGWLPATNCCNWVGVFCDDATGRVNALNVYPTSNPTTTIPSAIGDLPFLTHIDIRTRHHLTGPIPASISRLTRLTWLRLDHNSLTGNVPSFLFHLPALDYLDLSSNQLSGTIPANVAHSPVTYLFLTGNNLTGSIPASFTDSSITTLFLDHNYLTGQLPASFSNAKFENVDISANRLTGDASILFGAKKPLGILTMSRNLFEFNLTTVVFPEVMEVLNMDHNKIYGSIPEMITKLEGLQVLNVSYNQLCGQIPRGNKLGNLFELNQYNYFRNKCLCGAPLRACT